MRTFLLSTAAVVLLCCPPVHADPVPPKLCIVVAGDADPLLRERARTLQSTLDARPAVRTVADPDVRAALRGDPVADPSLAPYVDLRRVLTGGESDAPTLHRVGERLGCAFTVELWSRPEGFRVQLFDLVRERFHPPVDGPDVAPDVADSYVVPHATGDRVIAPPRETSVVPVRTAAPTAAVRTRALPRRPAAPPSVSPGVWGWAIAGGVAAALLGGFIIAQSLQPGAPLIVIEHPPVGGSP